MLSDNYSIGFIGYGNMGDAIGTSLIDSNLSVSIFAAESNDDRKQWIGLNRPEIVIVTIDELLAKCQFVFLAIKPQQFSELSNQIKDKIVSNQVIISMMAGISIQRIANLLDHKEIVRIMPNTPASLNQGVTGIFFSESVYNQKDIIQKICSSFGLVVVLDREDDIHSITALSGSGPAFFYRMVDAFIEFAKDQNLSDAVAYELVVQTLVGSGAMLQQHSDPKVLIDQVTSPNGTTFAGLQAMNSGQFNKLVYNVLERAKDRSIELSEEV